MGALTRVCRRFKAYRPYARVQERTQRCFYVKGPFALRMREGNDSAVAISVLHKRTVFGCSVRNNMSHLPVVTRVFFQFPRYALK